MQSGDMKSNPVQLTVKVDPPVVTRVDKLIPSLSKLRGVSASRADVLREALLRGLASLEGK
jgi:hypothetical protein